MHQLFSRFDAKSNDPHEQKNHGVGFVSRISLETLQACLLDGFDLLLSDAQTLHVTSKRCDCVGWQSNPLGCSHGDEFLRFLRNNGLKLRTPNWIRIDFIRLTVL